MSDRAATILIGSVVLLALLWLALQKAVLFVAAVVSAMLSSPLLLVALAIVVTIGVAWLFAYLWSRMQS